MRLSELFQVLIGLLLCMSLMECGRTDHVHLKIHVPDVVHKHKHIKTKYVHVFHPKVVQADHHSSIKYLHSRKDPNVGFPQGNTEFRISEDDFNKWRQEQQRRALEKRKRHQQQHQDDYYDNEEEDESNYEDDLFKKHRANKANSAALNKKAPQRDNHNYNPDYDSSNADKVYAKQPPTRKTSANKKQRPNRPTKRTRPIDDDDFKKYQVYGTTNVDAESSNVEQQYTSIDPTAIDPGYYSTLPRDVQQVPAGNQDDIYSGLISKKYNKNIEDKSKLLADINYNRKQQTKNSLQRRRGQ